MRVVLCPALDPANEWELQPGESVRVGSDIQFCDLVVQDSRISAAHFVVECDEGGAQIRDLGGAQGTFVNGLKIKTYRLSDQDVIEAGNTKFNVAIEGGKEAEKSAEKQTGASAATDETTDSATAGEQQKEEELPPLEGPQGRLLEILEAQNDPLYALLDAAVTGRVLQMVSESGEESRSLFQGPDAQDLIPFAPYLVVLRKDAKLLRQIIEEGWGKSWGVILSSKQEFMTIFHHVRRFLNAQREDGKKLYFRFYDPRVLRVFLPTCNATEAAEFFGPVSFYLIEDEKDTIALEMQATYQGVEREEHVLVEEKEESEDKEAKPGENEDEIPQLGLKAQGGAWEPKSTAQPFIIRDEQWLAMERGSIKDFILRMESHLKTNHAPKLEGLDDETLRRRMIFGIRRAKAYGITKENTLTAFVALMFEISPNFDEQPNIAKALRDDRIPPDDRIKQLPEITTDVDWQDAMKRAKPEVWEMAR